MLREEKSILERRNLYIITLRKNFPVPKGHNANFVWNQNEMLQNSRNAKRYFNINI